MMVIFLFLGEFEGGLFWPPSEGQETPKRRKHPEISAD